MNINNLFGGRRATNDQNEVSAPATPRTVATINAEHEAAKAAVDTLAEKIAVATDLLNYAREQYDASVSRYALSGGREPDHSTIEKEIARLEALRRVMGEQQDALTRLGAELAQAQRAENTANAEASVEDAAKEAANDLQAFLQIAYAAKAAETALFDRVFGSALKGGLGSRARTVRFDIARKVIDACQELGYKINPDWHCDGLPNLGDPERAAQSRVFDLYRQITRMAECPVYDPREVGELVVEVPMER